MYHQNDERIESHIYLAILTYGLVNTIMYMLKSEGIHYDWSNILRILSNHTLQTVVYKTDKKVIHVRRATEPSWEVKRLFSATSCKHSIKPIKKYVICH